MQISDSGFIFSLFNKNLLRVSQMLMMKNNKVFTDQKQYNMSKYGNVVAFDLIGNEYVIIYCGASDILVFTIYNNIYLYYKMKMPLYSEYKQFIFYQGFMQKKKFYENLVYSPENVIRVYNRNILAIMMFNNDQLVSNRREAFIFIYYLDTN